MRPILRSLILLLLVVVGVPATGYATRQPDVRVASELIEPIRTERPIKLIRWQPQEGSATVHDHDDAEVTEDLELPALDTLAAAALEPETAPKVEPHVHPTTPTQTRAAARPAPKPRAPEPTHTHHPPKPEPEPESEPATPPPNSSYSKDEVKAQIRAAWPADDDEAIQVVGCETGWTYDPRTTSSNGYYGLWQFSQGTWERWGGSGDPRDASPTEQTRVAANLYEARGWAPWPACSPSEETPDPSDEESPS